MPVAAVPHLSQVHTSYLVLGTLALIALAAGVFYQTGILGWLLTGIGRGVQFSLRAGFRLWAACFSWAPWPVYLAAVVAALGLGIWTGLPALALLCGLLLAFMGTTACL